MNETVAYDSEALDFATITGACSAAYGDAAAAALTLLTSASDRGDGLRRPVSVSAKALAKAIGTCHKTADTALHQLLDRGQIRKLGRDLGTGASVYAVGAATLPPHPVTARGYRLTVTPIDSVNDSNIAGAIVASADARACADGSLDETEAYKRAPSVAVLVRDNVHVL